MSRVVAHEPCPRCRERGQDRRGDNLGIYEDGGYHCFNCGYHKGGKFQLTFVNKEKRDYKETVLPDDFQREVPAECWKWLLQYGLPYSYWKDHCGYSPSLNRLIITVGQPIRFAQGRAFTVGDQKWYNFGDKSGCTDIIGEELSGPVVLVEDLISQHKVGQVTPALCLFGTSVSDNVIGKLVRFQRPIVLWLDNDQQGLLAKKVNRLQLLTNLDTSIVVTERDPKSIPINEIKEILL